jgi:hypothetical protein
VIPRAEPGAVDAAARGGRLARSIDALWVPAAAAMSAVFALLNFHALHLFHTVDKHLVFRDRILHGFDTEYRLLPPTFPMWGYGWVLLLTTRTSWLIVLQMTVALFAAWYFVRALAAAGVLNRFSRVLLPIGIVLCAPWFAYHSIVWSQSLATSLLMLSVAMLIAAASGGHAKARLLGMSACCMGLNLNLASDLFLLPVLLALTCWAVAKWSRFTAADVAGWLAAVVLMLTPWMIYSWRAVGAPLVKSSNQGHVFLIGLGQDPAGRFGITYSDDDPTMYQIIRERLGASFARRPYASCSYEADQVLKPAFVAIVSRQPWAYLDLVGFKLRELLLGRVGTYQGEFDEGANVGAFGIGSSVRDFVRRYTRRTGRLLQQGTTLFAPLVAWAAIRRRAWPWVVIFVPIVYQYISCSVAVVQPQYVSNLILLQVPIIVHGVAIPFAWVWSFATRTSSVAAP